MVKMEDGGDESMEYDNKLATLVGAKGFRIVLALERSDTYACISKRSRR
jgi:hypothetical protein